MMSLLQLCAWLFAVSALGVYAADGINDRFRTTVEPFVAKHCAACHSSPDDEGKLALVGRSASDAANADVELWKSVAHQLSLGLMPPEGEARPTREETAAVVAWIGDALGDSAGVLDAAQLPGFGNYVNHEALFTEPAVRRAASPARLWRISPHIFAQTFNAVSGHRFFGVQRQGGDGLHPALPFLTPPHGFRDQAPGHGFEDATTDLIVGAAWELTGYQLDGPPRTLAKVKAQRQGKPEPSQSLERLVDPQFYDVLRSDAPSDVDYRKAIQHQIHVVLQRPPTTDELTSLLTLIKQTERESGPKTALRTALAAVLLKPESLFRFELGSGEADSQGRVRLSSREIAYALHYALGDRPPSAEFLQAAESGALATADDVRRAAQALLDDRRVEKPRLLRFFREYFEYPRAAEVFKDVPPNDPNYATQADLIVDVLVNDADLLVSHILREDRDVLRRLLTTPQMFVNIRENGNIAHARNKKRMKNLFFEYDLPRDWTWTAEQPVDVSKTKIGLLMHPAWLLAFSDNEKNQAIQRGLWIRTKLLGGTVPDVPIGVDARLPNDETLTLREKMHVTQEAYCAKCHSKMDSLGLPFEQFDYYARHRTTEVGKPVETSGLIACGDPQLDGPVADPYEYVRRLADSRRVQQVFVRHAFRYWLGRNETLDDAPTLIDADRAYTESGGSMKALVASLLASDSFLYRRLPTRSVSEGSADSTTGER